MAYGEATFGGGQYRLNVAADADGYNYVKVSASVTKLTGTNYTGYYTYSSMPVKVWLNGGLASDGGWTYDFRGAGSGHTIAVFDNWRYNVGAGNLTVQVNVTMGSPMGTASVSLSVGISNPPTVPCAPTTMGLDEPTTTTLRYRFSGNCDGGSGITGWQAQIATDAAFTKNLQTVSSSGTTVFTGLIPGTTHYARSRGSNAVGWSGWSGTSSATTLPAVAPGMAVSSSPSGLSATVTLSSPGGVTGVDHYAIQMSPVPPGLITDYITTTNTYSVSGLTPGAIYQWRSSAFIGTYQSPWTGWLQVKQLNPSTSPGDYFDGSTPATADQTYAWTGTPDNSTSTATGVGVAGWLAFAAGGATGLTGVIARVSDPRVPGGQSFAARATFFSSATAAGFVAGTSASATTGADVAPTVTYTGSIYVKPSRAQLLAARIQWNKLDGTTSTGVSTGTPVLAPAGAWTRLTVTAAAPALSEWAGVGVIDVAGTGWSAWKGGESLTMDGAMLSLGDYATEYFDGSFTDGGGYTYDWVDPKKPNASPSTRSYASANPADLLIDPDCPPVPSPPRPPAIADPCVDSVGVWRRYYAEIPATGVSDWLDTLPSFTLKTFGLAERQVRIRIYANPFGYPLTEVDTTSWCGEQIVSYIPASTTMTLDGEIQRVFASVAGGPTTPADHLLYGTGGTPASWPVLSCGMSYMVSFDTPLGGATPPAGNLAVDIDLTRRT